jgi:hypothetical protein
MNKFTTITLKNGNILAYYENSSEVTIHPNGDYFCSSNHRLCFERPSHSTIIKALRPKGKNITFDIYYGNNQPKLETKQNRDTL